MKKSEMAEKLNEHIVNNDAEANTILDFLTDMGMLPPFWQERTALGIIKQGSTWESEDEP